MCPCGMRYRQRVRDCAASAPATVLAGSRCYVRWASVSSRCASALQVLMDHFEADARAGLSIAALAAAELG